MIKSKYFCYYSACFIAATFWRVASCLSTSFYSLFVTLYCVQNMPLTSKIKELTLVIFRVLFYIQISIDKGVVARRRQQRRRVERKSTPILQSSCVALLPYAEAFASVAVMLFGPRFGRLWVNAASMIPFQKVSTSLNHLFVPHAYCRHSRSHTCYFYCFQLIFWTNWYKKKRRCCNFVWLLLWLWLFGVVGSLLSLRNRAHDWLDDDLCSLGVCWCDFKPLKSLFVLLFYGWSNCCYVFGVF